MGGLRSMMGSRTLGARWTAGARLPVLAVILLVSGCGGGSSKTPAQAQNTASVSATAAAAVAQPPSTSAQTPNRHRDGTLRHRASHPPPPHVKAGASNRTTIHRKRSAPVSTHRQRPSTHTIPTHASSPPVDQTATFKTAYLSAIAQLTQTSHTIRNAFTAAPSQTTAQFVASFRSLTTRWQTQLGELEALHPPAGVAAQFTSLTAAGRRVESALKALTAAARVHHRRASAQAVISLGTSLAAAHAADAAIERKLAVS